MQTPPSQCPACQQAMVIERLRCEACATAVEGKFGLDWPSQLSPTQLSFVKVFLTARGKIKDVEQALGISYPTVVSRLDDVVARLEAPAERRAPDAKWRLKLLERLAKGELTLEETEQALRERSKEKP